MPEPIVELERTILWSQSELDKGESVWGLGDIDRGFQNMGMEITRLRAELAAVKDALDMETQGKYSGLMLELADKRAKQISDALEANMLRAELATTKEQLDGCLEIREKQDAELAAAQAALREAQKDAERYRWLRDDRNQTVRLLSQYADHTLDAKIDTAIQGGKKSNRQPGR